MKRVQLPRGWRVEVLSRSHNRRSFSCGLSAVDGWLRKCALQNQRKHLSVTKVLLSEPTRIVGFYTLAMGQVDFGDLPLEMVRRLPERRLPVALLAWLGVDSQYQGRHIGTRLLALALRNLYDAREVFPFVAVILDCLDDDARRFYSKFDFLELPGHANRLYLSAARLQMLVESD